MEFIHVLSTKPMNLPVRPPILPREFATPFAAPEIAGPAAEVTLERPSWALEAYWDADPEAFEAVSLAASVAFAVALDSNLRAAMRRAPDWRRTGRVRACDDMMAGR
jgi:hypothetical protein